MENRLIANSLPENCPISVILEEGTVEYHRRVLLDDLNEKAYCDRFISEMNINKDGVVKKVEMMTLDEIKRFSGY